MPAVLGTLIIVVMLVSGIDYLARVSYQSGVLWGRRTGAEWILQAGLNRATKAMVRPGDPMREALFDRRSTLWDFGGERVSIRLENESEKVDVNVADPRLVMNRLTRVLVGAPAGLIERILSRLIDVRGRRIVLLSPEMLLPLDQRFGPLAEAMRQATTTSSGQQTPSLPAVAQQQEGEYLEGSPNPMQVAQETSGTISSLSRPIYRLTASLVGNGPAQFGVPHLSKTLILMLSANDQRAFRLVDGSL